MEFPDRAGEVGLVGEGIPDAITGRGEVMLKSNVDLTSGES